MKVIAYSPKELIKAVKRLILNEIFSNNFFQHEYGSKLNKIKNHMA